MHLSDPVLFLNTFLYERKWRKQVTQFELPWNAESICSHGLWIWDPGKIIWELIVVVRSKEIHLRLLIDSGCLPKNTGI